MILACAWLIRALMQFFSLCLTCRFSSDEREFFSCSANMSNLTVLNAENPKTNAIFPYGTFLFFHFSPASNGTQYRSLFTVFAHFFPIKTIQNWLLIPVNSPSDQKHRQNNAIEKLLAFSIKKNRIVVLNRLIFEVLRFSAYICFGCGELKMYYWFYGINV